MNRILLILIFCRTILLAEDSLRIAKGSWMASGSFEYTLHSSDISSGNDRTTKIDIIPTYFLTKNVGLGLGLQTYLTRRDSYNSEVYYIHPDILLVTNIKIPMCEEFVYPYIGIGSIIHESYSNSEFINRGSALISKFGAIVFLNKYVALSPEYLLEYRRFTTGGIPVEYDDYRNKLLISLKIFW